MNKKKLIIKSKGSAGIQLKNQKNVEGQGYQSQQLSKQPSFENSEVTIKGSKPFKIKKIQVFRSPNPDQVPTPTTVTNDLPGTATTAGTQSSINIKNRRLKSTEAKQHSGTDQTNEISMDYEELNRLI